MFTVEITFKNTPLAMSVQRKTAEDAEAAYQQVLAAIRGGAPVLELTCDRQTDKKLAILASEISAVQIYEKSGATGSSGRPPGFFALTE